MKKPTFEPVYHQDGTSEFDDFLDSLPNKDRLKLLTILEQIEDKGLTVAIKLLWVKKLEDNLFEVRSKFGSNIQRALYFHVIDNRFKITHGFSKKTNKTPEREKEHARVIRNKFLKGELK